MAFLNYFVHKLVNNLTNYVGLAAGLGCLAELIRVELRVCRRLDPSSGLMAVGSTRLWHLVMN